MTRMDVAVDAECRPADGKLLLDALEAAPLPQGWRTSSVGSPAPLCTSRQGRASMCWPARIAATQDEAGRAVRTDPSRGRTALRPSSCDARASGRRAIPRRSGRRGTAISTSRVTRLAREVQTVEIGGVKRGELSYSQGERLAMFFDLERLGLARMYYPKSAYADRRRLASKLGYGMNDSGVGPIEVELGDLLSPYVAAVVPQPSSSGHRPAGRGPLLRRGAYLTRELHGRRLRPLQVERAVIDVVGLSTPATSLVPTAALGLNPLPPVHTKATQQALGHRSSMGSRSDRFKLSAAPDREVAASMQPGSDEPAA